MMRRMLMLMNLAVLLAPGVLMSQDNAANDPNGTEIRIVYLKYFAARDACSILETLCADDDTRIIMDESANRLILRTTDNRMPQLLEIIEQLDVESVSAPRSEPLLCRVYMVEIPPKQSNLKPFTVLLRAPSPVDSQQLLNAIEEKEDLRIGRLLQGGEWAPDGEPQILIKGVAASKAVIKRMIEAIPQSQVSDLMCDDGTSVGTAPAAEINQLPEQLQQHIHKFLGNELQTVGYWFGNLSSPGEVKAPIGPWTLELKARSAQGADLSIEVNVVQEQQHVMDTDTTILSNSIQGRVGKPIIIGYNRESYGARTMGAMIILLEPDASL